jgi:lactate racemase
MEVQTRTIPYMNRSLEVVIPAQNLAFDVGPIDAVAASNPAGVVRAAIRNPIGTSPLGALLPRNGKVLIISDDNTRRTPARVIIPVLLDELNHCGVPDGDIRILIASGTHRPMTAHELELKFGQQVLSRVEVIPHNYKDPGALRDCGVTRRGTPIWLNRLAFEAGFRIAAGDIIPHYPAGWSGGAKAVLPGIAGEKTTAALHYLGCRNPVIRGAETEMRAEMEEVAAAAGLDFIVNTTLSRQGEIVDVVAGHYVKAHRAGVAKSEKVYGVPVPECVDLCLSISMPVDLDLFQAAKGICAAEIVTRAGGEIVLVSGCVEGISPAHPELADYMGRMSTADLWKLAESGAPPDPLTCAGAILINTVRDKAAITVATDGLAPDLCARLGIGHVAPDALPAYIERRLIETPTLRLGILRSGAELLPIGVGPR